VAAETTRLRNCRLQTKRPVEAQGVGVDRLHSKSDGDWIVWKTMSKTRTMLRSPAMQTTTPTTYLLTSSDLSRPRARLPSVRPMNRSRLPPPNVGNVIWLAQRIFERKMSILPKQHPTTAMTTHDWSVWWLHSTIPSFGTRSLCKSGPSSEYTVLGFGRGMRST
jgi:hypothetical protein